MVRLPHRRWALATLTFLLMIPAQVGLIGTATAAESDPGYITLLFARAQMRATDGCVPVAGSVSLFDIAEALSLRGVVGSAAVVTDRTNESSERCIADIGTQASWDQLATLRDAYSWTMVSAGRAHADMTQLTPAGQHGESCGSLQALASHGHDRAWGLFGYANNRHNTQMQENVVSTCFAYGRTYSSDGTPRNQRSGLSYPWFQSTLSINGGECNDVTLPCFEIAGVPRRYLSPEQLGTFMAVGPDEWIVVQSYRFVQGTNLDATSTNRFDCSSPDWRQHWTSRPELYCFDDYLAALDDAIGRVGQAVVTTDPASVSEAWGQGGQQPGPDSTPPDGTVASPASNEVVGSVPVGLSGSATDDVGVAQVRVAIKDRGTGLWYHSDGSWGAYQVQQASLSAPGSTATSWSYDWTPPGGGSGSYGFGLTAVDTSANTDPTKPWITFTVNTQGTADM